MKQVFKKRLLKLAAFLHEIPRQKFDLSFISLVELKKIKLKETTPNFYIADDEFKNKVISQIKKMDCGTAACAIGWCPVVFPRSFKYNFSFMCDDFEYSKDDVIDLDVMLKDEDERYNFEAVEKFFGLNNEQSNYLFDEDSYKRNEKGPKSVAARIKRFVKVVDTDKATV